MKLQKPSNDSTYQTQSKAKQDSSKQLLKKTTKHQIQTTENEQTNNVDSKKLMTLKMLDNILKSLKMIHQHHKKSSSSSYKEQSNRSTTRRHKSNQQILIKIISLTHQAQFKTNIQSYLSMVS